MDIFTGLISYLIVALSLSLTSYITIFKPSIDLLEDIVGEKTSYSGIFAFLIWTVLGTLCAPWLLVILLSNNNTTIVEKIAVDLAEGYLEDDE